MTDAEIQEIVDAATERWRAKFLAEEKQRILDALLPIAGEQGWCDDLLYALDVVYPDHEGVYRTSDGFDMFDVGADGFNRAGFDNEGFDREGYGRNGHNREGMNRAGVMAADFRPGSLWCDDCNTYHPA